MLLTKRTTIITTQLSQPNHIAFTTSNTSTNRNQSEHLSFSNSVS